MSSPSRAALGTKKAGAPLRVVQPRNLPGLEGQITLLSPALSYLAAVQASCWAFTTVVAKVLEEAEKEPLPVQLAMRRVINSHLPQHFRILLSRPWTVLNTVDQSKVEAAFPTARRIWIFATRDVLDASHTDRDGSSWFSEIDFETERAEEDHGEQSTDSDPARNP